MFLIKVTFVIVPHNIHNKKLLLKSFQSERKKKMLDIDYRSGQETRK